MEMRARVPIPHVKVEDSHHPTRIFWEIGGKGKREESRTGGGGRGVEKESVLLAMSPCDQMGKPTHSISNLLSRVRPMSQ